MPQNKTYLVYIFLYKKIKEKTNHTNSVTHNEIVSVLRRNLSKIPRNIHYEIIKELEQLQLIKKINKFKYDIIGGNKERILLRYNYPL